MTVDRPRLPVLWERGTRYDASRPAPATGNRMPFGGSMLAPCLTSRPRIAPVHRLQISGPQAPALLSPPHKHTAAPIRHLASAKYPIGWTARHRVPRRLCRMRQPRLRVLPLPCSLYYFFLFSFFSVPWHRHLTAQSSDCLQLACPHAHTARLSHNPLQCLSSSYPAVDTCIMTQHMHGDP